MEFTTLALLILAAIGGSWIGAAIVTGMPKRAIQRGMGVALLVAAVLMIMTALNRFPGGGEATALTGGKLALACGINFALGALMTLGIGLYAPCMIMVSLMGMNPTAAFPIMMGSCAFLMQIAGTQFIAKGRYDLKAAMGLTLGGIPAVLVAAYLVRSLPLAAVRWLVVVVVVYTAVMLLRSPAPLSACRRPHPDRRTDDAHPLADVDGLRSPAGAPCGAGPRARPGAGTGPHARSRSPPPRSRTAA